MAVKKTSWFEVFFYVFKIVHLQQLKVYYILIN